MTVAELRWYAHRLVAMSPAEVGWRAADQARRVAWRSRRVPLGRPAARPRDTVANPQFRNLLAGAVLLPVDDPARLALIRAADDVLAGRWDVLGVVRDDMVDPEWFRDPGTGVYCDPDRYSFSIDFKDEAANGNAKQLWEVSRQHHLTVLAAAYHLTREDRYAEATARHLTSWWEANPFLSGVNWTCGIEAGIRLITWAWVRRLLDGWSGAPDLFERSPLALQQIAWHQEYLAGFRSRGSSANNHVIAEAAGQLVAACAFPWFRRSARWRDTALRVLETELEHNTFPSGINRELAFEYQGFVAELTLVALVEAAAAGCIPAPSTWSRLTAIIDAAAAALDTELQAPRQGDGDDGRGLVVDDPHANRWGTLLDAGAAVIGPMPWWPAAPASVVGVLLAAVRPAGALGPVTRPDQRPSHFADAGLTILRTPAGSRPEIWCRCDGGPHGFLSIAGHAHADALAVELRHDGVDILADPGTYCYHGEAKWRSYFRSTLAHNTLEVAGRDQSTSGGPFLWRRHAVTRLHDVRIGELGEQTWSADHDGYSDLEPPARHARRVTLDADRATVVIVDTLEGMGNHALRLPFHLGPLVQATKQTDRRVQLEWPGRDGPVLATIELPADLEWSLHRGESEPVLGWYSDRFGAKTPTTTLVGVGQSRPGGMRFETSVLFPTSTHEESPTVRRISAVRARS
jgi:Heparinase II/III-like protein/Heparinase II/III N-terminus